MIRTRGLLSNVYGVSSGMVSVVGGETGCNMHVRRVAAERESTGDEGRRDEARDGGCRLLACFVRCSTHTDTTGLGDGATVKCRSPFVPATRVSTPRPPTGGGPITQRLLLARCRFGPGRPKHPIEARLKLRKGWLMADGHGWRGDGRILGGGGGGTGGVRERASLLWSLATGRWSMILMDAGASRRNY